MGEDMREESDNVSGPSGNAFEVEDGPAPLCLGAQREVFREQGGADFAVTEVNAVVNRTGEKMAFHVASVKDGRPGAVCVVVLPGCAGREDSLAQERDPGGKRETRYLLARHWRVATGEWEWEFPRGMGEIGESPVQTALRELYEETGIEASASQVDILQTMHADTGVLKDSIAVARIAFNTAAQRQYAIDVTSGSAGTGVADAAAGTDWELSHMRWVTEGKLKQCIQGGGIVDGITLAAFGIALLHQAE